MALKFYWGLEANSTTLGSSDYSSGDTTASTIGSASISGTAAKIGSYGILSPSGIASNFTFNPASIWPATSTTHDTSRGSFGFWMYLVSTVPGNSLVYGLRMYGSVANYGIDTCFTNSGCLALVLRNGSAQYLYGSTPLTTAVWYFVVGRFDIANDKRAIEIYTDAGGGTLSLVSGSSAEDTTTDLSSYLSNTEVFSVMNVGIKSSTATDVYYDNFIISDNYDAPIQNNAFITAYGDYSESLLSVPVLRNYQSSVWG